MEFDRQDFDLGEAVFHMVNRSYRTFTREKWDDFICTAISLFAADDSVYKTALEKLEIFNYLFFNRLKFSIEENGIVAVPEVIDRRRGCAQTVALLWFVLAAEAGLPVQPLCYKGGFIPAWVENGRELMHINLLDHGNPALGFARPGAELRSLEALPELWRESISQ